jgi:hypothetical protein
MLKILSIVSIFLLFFTGITASISGFMLIYDPSGKPLRMNVSILAGSPFDSFFIPGIILFLFLGISSILIAFFVINDHTYSTRMIFYQGFVVIGWIVVQVIMINQFFYLQLIYVLIGAALVYIGYYGIANKDKIIRP